MQHTLTANDWQGVPQFVHVDGEHLQTFTIEGQPEVNLFMHERRFIVTYGLQVKSGLDHSEAAREIGCCLMHALACTGVDLD